MACQVPSPQNQSRRSGTFSRPARWPKTPGFPGQALRQAPAWPRAGQSACAPAAPCSPGRQCCLPGARSRPARAASAAWREPALLHVPHLLGQAQTSAVVVTHYRNRNLEIISPSQSCRFNMPGSLTLIYR